MKIEVESLKIYKHFSKLMAAEPLDVSGSGGLLGTAFKTSC